MPADYSDEAIICGHWPGVPMRRNASATRGLVHREQDSSCRNLSGPMKSWWKSKSSGKHFRCRSEMRFCWNQDCQYCRVTCQLPDEDEPHEMLSCKFIVMPGMEITEMSQELKWCLRAKMPSDTPVSS